MLFLFSAHTTAVLYGMSLIFRDLQRFSDVFIVFDAVSKLGMSFVTKVSMNVSDAMHMVRLIELKLSPDRQL